MSLPRNVRIVLALSVLAAVLRLAGLDAKGFWQDEAYTIARIEPGFGGMLGDVIDREGTPPLYYVLAWAWARAFGYGEVGLRSLSALAGVATVPIAYLAAKELVSRRAGQVTALLVAVNPLLVWYGQEVRAYALLVPLSALSVLFFARSLSAPDDRVGRDLAWWAVASAATITTHHFALFLILPEALWLLRTRRSAPALRAALGALCAVAAADLALALSQAGGGAGNWIEEMALHNRLVEIPAVFLIGVEAPSPILLAAIAAACAAVGLWLALTRADRTERDGAVLAAALAVAVVVIACIPALVGFDYLLYRYVLPALVPALIALGAGFAAPRAGVPGTAALGVLCALSLAVVFVTRDEPKYGKEVWRELASGLGPARSPRAIVATPGGAAKAGLKVYLPGSDEMAPAGATVREIVIVGAPRRPPGGRSRPRVPRPAEAPPTPADGFRFAGRVEDERYTLFTYRAEREAVVRPRELERTRIDETHVEVLLQPR